MDLLEAFSITNGNKIIEGEKVMRNYKITEEEKKILKRYDKAVRKDEIVDYFEDYSLKFLKNEIDLLYIDEQIFYFTFFLTKGFNLNGMDPWGECKSQVFDKNIITILEKLKTSTENEEIINYTEIMIEVIKIIQKYNFVEKR